MTTRESAMDEQQLDPDEITRALAYIRAHYRAHGSLSGALRSAVYVFDPDHPVLTASDTLPRLPGASS